MRNLIYFVVLIVTFSCSKQIELKGDWKINALVIDNIERKEVPEFPIISFRSDNLVFYFNTLWVYEIQGDSLFLAYQEEPEKIAQAFKIDFIDANHINLNYSRRIAIDSILGFIYIPYQSQWLKID
tara:strand:- start:193 stop:570 length:378 start_codon:yes stop_codon:yes gene_type:complete